MKSIFISLFNHFALKTSKKQILCLSDDWGSVRLRSKKAQDILVKKGLIIENRFDRYDSLESNDDLELLFEILTKYKDQNGNHPVLTAVSNVANPDFSNITASNFKEYHFEEVTLTYQRYPKSDRVLSLVQDGIRNRIFIPQSHGREHLQINWWLNELQNKSSFARLFFEEEYFFLGPKYLDFPKRKRGLGAAFDVWDRKDIDVQLDILKSALDLFKDLYGFSAKLFTPPSLYYNPRIEPTAFSNGVEWLDLGRFFKIPKPDGKESYQLNYLGRQKKSGLRVLVRNAVFETNISENDNGINRALYDIERAFNSKQPAIVSNHRASFVGTICSKNRDRGLKSLDELLSKVIRKWPDVEFISPNDLDLY